MNKHIWLLLAVMAFTTYLVRMIPFAFFRTKIQSKFFRDFLYYIPYAVLGAMTIPHIFYSGGGVIESAVGFVVAFVMAYMGFSLLPVAGAACAAAFLMGMLV